MSDSRTPVLVAEDEKTDAYILQLAFERAGVDNPLVVTSDGKDVVSYLTGAPPYGDRVAYPLPGLIVLDLKMPIMSGFDVLHWLRSQPAFAKLPAVVLSSSPDDSDIKKALALGAREYFIKPHDLGDFVQIVRTMHSRWLVPANA